MRKAIPLLIILVAHAISSAAKHFPSSPADWGSDTRRGSAESGPGGPGSKLPEDIVGYLASRALSPPIMDRDQVERTRRHYDQHSKDVNISSSLALRQRQQGPAIQLKRFHNDIKRALIEVYARKCDRLLDLACGRGGDLDKWFSAGIREVVGVDLSGNELEIARKRYKEQNARRNPSLFSVEFIQSDQLGVSVRPLHFGSKPGLFQAVSCMFAIHYFFQTEVAARNVLRTVQASLCPGGYFFGVLPDGSKIAKALEDNEEYTNEFIRLKREYKEAPYSEISEFGSMYLFSLHDTVTGQVDESAGSREFLVKEETLIRLAKEYGLEPVQTYKDDKLRDMLKGTQTDTLFKHFRPYYKGHNRKDLETASMLNSAFVFKRTSQMLAEGAASSTEIHGWGDSSTSERPAAHDTDLPGVCDVSGSNDGQGESLITKKRTRNDIGDDQEKNRPDDSQGPAHSRRKTGDESEHTEPVTEPLSELVIPLESMDM